MTYRAPVKDMLFVMQELAGIEAVAALPAYEDAGLETAAAVLEEEATLSGTPKLVRCRSGRRPVIAKPCKLPVP